MKKHMNLLRNSCDNTEIFDEGQSQIFSDLTPSSTEHTSRFSSFNESFKENEKSQKITKNEENQS